MNWTRTREQEIEIEIEIEIETKANALEIFEEEEKIAKRANDKE